jgi:hypothetical protein
MGITTPGQDSFRMAQGQLQAQPVPPDVISDFAANAVPRICGWLRDWDLDALGREIARAADQRDKPDPDRVQTAAGDAIATAQRLLEKNAPPLKPVSMRREQDSRQLWGIAFTNLPQRLAVEAFELFTKRPRLARCRFCRRAFVISTNATGSARSTCSAHLWNAATHELLEECIPTRQQLIAAHNESVVREQPGRKNKTLLEAKYRAQKAAKLAEAQHGLDSPEATTARKLAEGHERNHAAWRKTHPPEARGPKTRPTPNVVRSKERKATPV